MISAGKASRSSNIIDYFTSKVSFLKRLWQDKGVEAMETQKATGSSSREPTSQLTDDCFNDIGRNFNYDVCLLSLASNN